MNPDFGTPATAGNRHPWLSYGLLLICVAALAYDGHLEREAQLTADAAIAKGVAYWWDRPYLEAPDLLLQQTTAQAIDKHQGHYRRHRDERGAPLIAPSMKRRHQQVLSDLLSEAAAPIRELPRFRWGVRARSLDSTTYLTHLFVHSGWLHLIGNGFLLLVLAFYLERTWGSPLFALFLLATSLGAATAFRIGNPELTAPLIGTGGLVAGLLAAFAIRYRSIWRETPYGFVLLTGACWLLLPSWFGWEPSVLRDPSFSGPVAGNGSPAYWAIAGGFGCGLLLAAIVVFGKVEAALRGLSGASGREEPIDSDLELALTAHAEGRIEEAFELISQVLARRPGDRDALIAMWDVAIDLGRPLEASSAMLKVIRKEVRSKSPNAIEHWRELSELGLHSEAEPTLLIRIAALLQEAEQPAAALEALKLALDSADDWDATVVATRVARAAAELDPPTAVRAARLALGRPDLALEERQKLELLLEDLQPVTSRSDASVARSLRVEAAPSPEPVPVPELAPVREAAPSPEPTPLPERAPVLEAAPLAEPTPLPEPELASEAAARAFARSFEQIEADALEAPLRPTPIDLEIASRRQVEVVEAVPIELGGEGLVIEAEGGIKKRVPYARIGAIAAAAIEGLGPRAVIVVDLTLNWFESDQALRLIRLRADRFDPCSLLGSDKAPLDATRELIERLLQKTSANPLPGLESARGLQFTLFPDLASYERDVLSVERVESISAEFEAFQAD
jgi:membrane associated rhomboid family serine protease